MQQGIEEAFWRETQFFISFVSSRPMGERSEGEHSGPKFVCRNARDSSLPQCSELALGVKNSSILGTRG